MISKVRPSPSPATECQLLTLLSSSTSTAPSSFQFPSPSPSSSPTLFLSPLHPLILTLTPISLRLPLPLSFPLIPPPSLSLPLALSIPHHPPFPSRFPSPSHSLLVQPPPPPSSPLLLPLPFTRALFTIATPTQSANYCCASSSNSTAVLVLCDVALGSQYELIGADIKAKVTVYYAHKLILFSP